MKYQNLDIKSGFELNDIYLNQLKDFINATLYGPNIKISYLARLKSRKNNSLHHLTYITNEFYLNQFIQSLHEAAVISKDIFKTLKEPVNKSLLLVDKDPETSFFELHEILSQKKYYPLIESYKGTGCEIHDSVVILDNVVIKNNAKIHPNVVIYPNTIIDDDVEIRACSIIGGSGAEKKKLFNKMQMVSHAGGVYLGKNVTIGGSVTVDRGEMGEFTQVLENTKTDNLVHIAHNVIIGPDCFLTACSEISGSAIFGRGIWYAPQSCCNHEIVLGDYTYIGTGSVVVKDTKPFSFVYGNPGKQYGWMCKCQKYKLSFEIDNIAICKCGRKYKFESEHVCLIEDT